VSAMPARLASFGIVFRAAEQKRRTDIAVQLFLRSLLVRNRGEPSASIAEKSR
jgi:hypothetical protein